MLNLLLAVLLCLCYVWMMMLAKKGDNETPLRDRVSILHKTK